MADAERLHGREKKAGWGLMHLGHAPWPCTLASRLHFSALRVCESARSRPRLSQTLSGPRPPSRCAQKSFPRGSTLDSRSRLEQPSSTGPRPLQSSMPPSLPPSPCLPCLLPSPPPRSPSLRWSLWSNHNNCLADCSGPTAGLAVRLQIQIVHLRGLVPLKKVLPRFERTPVYKAVVLASS